MLNGDVMVSFLPSLLRKYSVLYDWMGGKPMALQALQAVVSPCKL